MPQGRNLAINLVVRSKQASKQLNQFETRTQRLGRALKVGLAAGAAVGAAAIGRFAGQSVSAASDLEEAFSKAQQVFGDATGEVVKFADTSVTDLGLSKQAALEAVGTFGNLATSFGIGQGKAAEMSTTLTQLAADLASFNNTSVEDAINALRSGLSGETEPLKRYGIVLQDTRLRAEALAMGLEVTKGALDPLTKSQAAYSLILKDSANAQGDFARTSDGLANTQRILNAAVEDAKAEIGQGLVSSLQSASQAAGGPEGMAQSIKETAEYVGDLTRGVGVLVDDIANLTDGFNDATGAAVSFGGFLRAGLAIGTAGLSESAISAADSLAKLGAAADLVERSNAGLIPVADHLAHSLEEQRKAADRVADSMENAAEATFNYRRQRTLDANANYRDAAVRARMVNEYESLGDSVESYTRSTGGSTRATNASSQAAERLRRDLADVNTELSTARSAVDAATAAYDSFASDVNSALGSGISLAAAFTGEQAKKEIEESGQVSAETWINAFKAQLGSAEAAGTALDELDAALRQPNGELVAGAEALFQQILTVPTGLIPQVVSELVDSGLAPNLAGSLNHVFNGPVGTAWAETFRGEGVTAAQDILDGLDESATALEGKFEALGKKVGKDIRKGIKAEIEAVLDEIDALEGRVTGARGGVQATRGGRDFRARNLAGRRGAPVSEARAIAELLRNAERATGAAP